MKSEHEKRIDKMTPERRKLYFTIVKLREKIGNIGFNIVEELRKLRK